MKLGLPGKIGVSTALAGVATALGLAGREHFAAADVVMLYLSAIIVCAFWFGRAPALVAAALSVAGYDFLFVPPFYTFAVDHERHLVTFFMMFAIAILISELTRKIREQQRLVREREEKSAVLALRARTEEMRSAVLSSVSHDLRTPLAVITGAATTLRDQGAALDQAQRADMLNTVCDEAVRLEQLVANLLQMTRVLSGSLDVKRDWVPLEEIVGAALTRLDSQLGQHRITIDLPDDLPLLSADPILLEQVLLNLLENAAKYTPGGTEIEIAARISGDAMQITIADRGPGLPPGSEDRVFERFQRGNHPGIDGVGLGLPICAGMIAAHGGEIHAANRPGGGAVFTITLPLASGAPRMPIEPDAPVATEARA